MSLWHRMSRHSTPGSSCHDFILRVYIGRSGIQGPLSALCIGPSSLVARTLTIVKSSWQQSSALHVSLRSCSTLLLQSKLKDYAAGAGTQPPQPHRCTSILLGLHCTVVYAGFDCWTCRSLYTISSDVIRVDHETRVSADPVFYWGHDLIHHSQHWACSWTACP